tara:strand:- start:104 stop:232 length:129 start_codon:yes stop_codon:yes gene_type:complete
MQNLSTIKKKISKKNKKIENENPSAKLAEFFNGAIINLDKKY